MSKINETFWEEMFTYYAQIKNPSQEDIVALLREIQEAIGCIPKTFQERAATCMKTSPALISTIIKKYPSLKEESFQHEIRVCTGPCFTSKGSLEIQKELQNLLHIKTNQVTKDQRIYLTTQCCMKHCKKGPNLMINGKVFHGLTKERVIELLQDLPPLSFL